MASLTVTRPYRDRRVAPVGGLFDGLRAYLGLLLADKIFCFKFVIFCLEQDVKLFHCNVSSVWSIFYLKAITQIFLKFF